MQSNGSRLTIENGDVKISLTEIGFQFHKNHFMKRTIFLFSVVCFTTLVILGQPPQIQHGKTASEAKTGILLLAHGGQSAWNEEVVRLAAAVNNTMPVETAFGMATKRNIQSAIDRLTARGVSNIVAVPLFVSSNSSVITSTEFLLGLRAEAPADLAMFAKMGHGSGASHDSHQNEGTPFDATTPVRSPAAITMTPALNDHRIVADILLARALAISQRPQDEVVVLVAHGPVSDETNNKWLRDMASLAKHVESKSGYARIEYLTVRDDAPEPIRTKATEELRTVVKRAIGENRRVLIVPLLISYGGIEAGIRKRLDGLDYTISPKALLPDDRLVQWVTDSAKSAPPKR